jgi:hypothetical protein
MGSNNRGHSQRAGWSDFLGPWIWDVVNYEMIMGKMNLDSMVNNKAEK